MASDLFDFDDNEQAPKKRDNLFVWTVFILLLIGLAFACWLGSFYIFGHPEQPRAYALLKKLKKIQPPKRFEKTAAPLGEYLTAKKLFERYSTYTPLQLEHENAELLRTFLTNYRETKKLVPYVWGNFTIAGVAAMKQNDFIPSGMAALAQSNEFPQVLIEHLYPMGSDDVKRARQVLVMGNPIKLEKTRDFGAIIHVEKVAEGRLQFTVVPLTYAGYGLTGGEGTFTTQPPLDLNLSPGLPVMQGPRFEEAMKTYAGYRRNKPLPDATAPGELAIIPKGPEIVRLDGPGGLKLPEAGALPPMPVATPIPIAGTGTGRTSAADLAMNATPMPVATPIPVATPMPMDPRAVTAQPAPNVPPGVLKPFIASNTPPSLPGPQGSQWRTYKPGALPPGRVFGAGDVVTMADRGLPNERRYLRGDFVVKAIRDNSAVIRPRLANGEADAAVRVIVEYPDGSVPPRKAAPWSAMKRGPTRSPTSGAEPPAR